MMYVNLFLELEHVHVRNVFQSVDLGNIEDRVESVRKFPVSFDHFMKFNNPEHLAPNVDGLAWDGVSVHTFPSHCASALH